MTLIQIDTGQVSGTGSKFVQLRSEVDSLITNAKNMMGDLEMQFKGQRARRIFDQWLEMLPRLQAASETLQGAGDLLSQASEAFRMVDEQ